MHHSYSTKNIHHSVLTVHINTYIRICTVLHSVLTVHINTYIRICTVLQTVVLYSRLSFMHEYTYIAILTQTEAIGAATASGGGCAHIASFRVRILTSCISRETYNVHVLRRSLPTCNVHCISAFRVLSSLAY